MQNFINTDTHDAQTGGKLSFESEMPVVARSATSAGIAINHATRWVLTHHLQVSMTKLLPAEIKKRLSRLWY